MTKKHFEAVARTIHHNKNMCDNEAERNIVLDVALNLSATFSEINPRFNAKKFLTACGF